MQSDNKEKNLYLIIGLGKSGFWAAKLLHSKGEKVIVIDSNNNDVINSYKKELEKLSIEVYLNIPFEFKEIRRWIHKINSVIISPAIGLDNKTVLEFKKLGIKVMGEVNIGWQNLNHLNWIAITGTNGKTSVTHLLSHILCKNNLLAPAAGNIGTPFCKYAHNLKDKKIDMIVAELSSYQIEIGTEINPKIGIWTTFSPDHLDRHKTIENYFNIKNSLLRNSETRIYNYDDEHLKSSSNILSKGIWITSNPKNSNNQLCHYWIDKEGFIVEKGEKLFNSSILKLVGNHNKQNLLLATAAARFIGISGDKIKKALLNYQNLPHRLETVYKTERIEIINDSKATNFESAIAGIRAYKKNQIIIAGGRMKKGNHKFWARTILKKGHSIFLYGENAKDLQEILKVEGFNKDIFIYENLKELIKKVLVYSEKRSSRTILFSPACSSFDQFKNYEERGDYFKKLVQNHFF
tara:strand:+ start:3649 stop:5040 length:1392 start_codon:yes stop_codon:yes gene_type:complete